MKAVVLLSGGQDSTTALYWAGTMFDHLYAVSFDYGQRHRIELQAAKQIVLTCPAVVQHKVLKIPALEQLAGSSLTDNKREIKASGGRGGLPNTFVPGRNIIFLTLAAAWAYQLGIRDIVMGVCQTDYSGYPDCRRQFVNSFRGTFSLAAEYDIQIHTPLMYLTKAETVKLATRLDGCMDALKCSYTCYEGKDKPCLVCPACILRDKGFKEAGTRDPAL